MNENAARAVGLDEPLEAEPRGIGDVRDVFARVDRLAAVLAGESDESDRLGTLTPTAIDALRRSGLLGLGVRIRSGQYVGTLDVIVDVARRLGSACPASAWAVLRLMEGQRLLENFGQFRNRLDALVACPSRSGGFADAVRGRLRLSGEWSTVAAAAVADIFVLAVDTADGPLLVALTADQCQVSQRPDPGLPGAPGFRSVRVDNVEYDPSLAVRPETMFGLPGPESGGLAVVTCGVAVGAAERAIEHLRNHVVRRAQSEERSLSGVPTANTDPLAFGRFEGNDQLQSLQTRLGDAIDSLITVVLRWDDAIETLVTAAEHPPVALEAAISARLGASAAFSGAHQILVGVVDGLPVDNTLAEVQRAQRTIELIGRMQSLNRSELVEATGRVAAARSFESLTRTREIDRTLRVN